MQTLDDQINTIERALGERMIEHALVIVRSWLNELGENNPYEQAAERIRKTYEELFAEWLSVGTEDTDIRLNRLTGETYQLVDAVYAALRVKRGMSPDMHGFNPDQPQSVMHYFANCVLFRDKDFEWLRDICNDEARSATALMAVGALAKNMRECFNIDAFLTLIEGMNAANDMVADQCMASVFMLLIHYDIRIDFFEQLQEAFLEAFTAQEDEGDHAFEVLCAIISSTRRPDGEQAGKVTFNQLPEELQELIEKTGMKGQMSTITAWLPESEQEYVQGLVELLPDTWLYEIIVDENPVRASFIAQLYLSIGRMDLLWDNLDVAERWLVKQLRGGSAGSMDYINYAHCLLLRGDRMMAYEYYRQARQLCKGPKEFFNLFRPDRRALVDHGIPVEQIYLLEDRLINQ